jgi:hypothetical protein
MKNATKQLCTPSELEVKSVYTQEDFGVSGGGRPEAPGAYPFTRGIHETMYRGRLWTMRQYAGFGTAREANKRYHYLLKQGTTVARRQAIIRRLDREGFEARSLWHPIHRLPPYQDSAAPDLPHAMELYARAISLPSSVGLELGEAQRCAKALQQAARAH